MRDARRERAAALCALTVLCVLGFASCGGDSGSSSTQTQATSAQKAGQADTKGGGQADTKGGQASGQRKDSKGSGSGKGSGAGEGSGNSSGSEGAKHHTVAEVSTPLKVSGGGSTQFRTKGGDNSVQNYGEEGNKSELQEAAELTHDFYVARGTGDWAKTCSYITASLRKQLEELGKKSGAEGCAAFLAGFTTALSPSVWRQITRIDAGSFRHDNQQGFLIYYGAENTVYAMPMRYEGGEWKIGALSAAALPGA